MEIKNPDVLTKEKETLFITLFAKAIDYRSGNSILNDRLADDIVKNIKNDLTKYKGFGSNIIVLRAKQFDDWVSEFISYNRKGIVVYLGCGLDTRVKRINPPTDILWFDVDYPEVIEFRKKFFSESINYKMIPSSVNGPSWLQNIPRDLPALILAEGLLEYLTQEEVKALFKRVIDHFQNGELIFDVMSSFAIKSGEKKLAETTGAIHKWAVDDLNEADQLNQKMERIDQLSVFKSKYIQNLPIGKRLLFNFLSHIKLFRNMLIMLKYRI